MHEKPKLLCVRASVLREPFVGQSNPRACIPSPCVRKRPKEAGIEAVRSRSVAAGGRSVHVR